MRTTKITRWAAAALVSGLVLAACSDGSTATKSTGDTSDDTEATSSEGTPTTEEVEELPFDASEINLGLSIQNSERSFFVGMQTGATAAAEETGVNLEVVSANDDAAKQQADVEKMIADGVDGILVSPVDSKEAQVYADLAADANIPLLAVANQLGDIDQFGPQFVFPGTVALVTNDDVDMGRKAASQIARNADGQISVAVLKGPEAAANTRLRLEGFTEELDGSGTDYNIVSSESGDWSSESGKEVCAKIFDGSNEVDFLFSMSDAMTTGCVEALDGADIPANIVSIGGNETGIQLLVEDKVLGTVCQKPGTMGELAVETMLESLETGDWSKGLVFYSTPVVTKDSLDRCEPEW